MSDKTMWRTRIGGQLYVKTIRSIYDGGADPERPFSYRTILVNGAGNDCLVQRLECFEPTKNIKINHLKSYDHDQSVRTLKLIYRSVAREVQQAIAGNFPREY